jgi:RNA polymerase sigma factor (sigma-70 family)
MTEPLAIERELRERGPLVLAALARRDGDFAACEDAVQEALLAAAVQWPRDGIPDQPTAWLTRVARRRRIEAIRSETARRRREDADGRTAPTATVGAIADGPLTTEVDDSLTLFLLCCHPALTRPSQVALTLRAVGGLTTQEIARAFLVPESTIAQRISRAKASIRASGAGFRLPPPDERPARIAAVLEVLYLVFNEGYVASSGSTLQRVELSTEAIRLTRQLHALVPDDGEIAGLLALMLLTDARRPARTTPDGAIIPLDEQDRWRWDRGAIAEGRALVAGALRDHPLGPYQLQAAIAALHDEAPSAEATDWMQILVLYDLLARVAPGPMVTLNRIVALSMVDGPEAGLRALDAVADDPALRGHHRVDAIRGHLLERIGEATAAVAAYERAAERTLSRPEQRYLRAKAGRLTGTPGRPTLSA